MTIRVHLTTDRIRKLVTPTERCYVFDDAPKQLCVRVMPTGVKSFVFASKLQGTPLRITIGSTDVWAVDKAREEAKRLQTLIDQGIDPREVEKEKRRVKEAALQESKAKETYTLKALCEAYVGYLRGAGKQKSAIDTQSAFSVHVFKAWPEYAALPAQEVTSLHIAAIIRKPTEAGRKRTPGILRNYLTAAFNAARRAPFDAKMPGTLIPFKITTNPCEIIPTIAVNRGERTLTADEVKDYMKALKEDPAGLALQVNLYIAGQRIAQLLRAKVSDYFPDTQILRLWDGKGKRTQAREHLLPLAPKAVAIVQMLVRHAKEADSPLFGIKGQTVGNRVRDISLEMGGVPFTLRDIRRTCETMLAGMKISKDIRSQLLSHGISGVQAAHYDKYEYIDEKHAALLAWEQRLDNIANGTQYSNVHVLAQVA